jgi:roadblock/LC7 domain-containing protein
MRTIDPRRKHMASLEELIQIEGVVAAIEWTKDGSLIDYKASIALSRGLAAGAAQFQETITSTFDKLSESFSEMSGMNWTPQHGWVYSGGDWSIVVASHKGIFVETAKADFNALLRVLADKSSPAR